jgi:hypothetical protein
MMDVGREGRPRRRVDYGHVDLRRGRAGEIGVLEGVALDLLLGVEALRAGHAKRYAEHRGDREFQIGLQSSPPCPSVVVIVCSIERR